MSLYFLEDKNRWRFNPFAKKFNPKLISAEEQTIKYWPELQAFGVFANETIKYDNPSTVSIKEKNTTNYFTEISYLTNPDNGKFRVDYNKKYLYNTGFIEFNSADNGKIIEIDYYGTGGSNRWPDPIEKLVIESTTTEYSAYQQLFNYALRGFSQTQSKPHISSLGFMDCDGFVEYSDGGTKHAKIINIQHVASLESFFVLYYTGISAGIFNQRYKYIFSATSNQLFLKLEIKRISVIG